jgi:hypothetical protein
VFFSFMGGVSFGALEHAGIPFPERVVYGQERAPR